MSRINGRQKGAAGEREFCRWLSDNLNVFAERNLEQTRNGGADITDVEPFYFEVKRVENLALDKWWIQVKKSVKGTDRIPVVAFRQNRKDWEFLIPATFIGLRLGYMRLTSRVFAKWAGNILAQCHEAAGQGQTAA